MIRNKFLKEDVRQKFSEKNAQSAIQSRNNDADRLIESWSKNNVGTTKLLDLAEKDRSKARNVAILLENQDIYNKQVLQLREDNQVSTDFQLTPLNLLKVVRIGAANSNRGNIFKEVALQTMRDIMVFIDTTFGKSTRGAVKGDVAYNSPLFPEYASSFHTAILATGDNASTSFSAGPINPAPILKYRVGLIVDGKLIGNDNGMGSLNGQFTLGSTTYVVAGSLDYATGGISGLTVTPAMPVNVELSMQFAWDSENIDAFEQYAGEAQLKVRVITFNPILQSLGYSYSTLAAQTLGSTGIGNMQEMIVKRIGDIHAARKDQMAFAFARSIAASQGAFTFDTDYANAGTDNDWNHVQRITETLGNIGTTIYGELQRGGVNALVAGIRAVNYLRKHRKYEMDNTQARTAGSYLDGYLEGIPVYVCPPGPGLVDKDEILCVYKNPEEDGEPSIVFGTFTELSAGLEYPEFYTKGNIATVEDRQPIQPKFVRLLTLQNLRG